VLCIADILLFQPGHFTVVEQQIIIMGFQDIAVANLVRSLVFGALFVLSADGQDIDPIKNLCSRWDHQCKRSPCGCLVYVFSQLTMLKPPF